MLRHVAPSAIDFPVKSYLDEIRSANQPGNAVLG
jgi:hypothetical protein